MAFLDETGLAELWSLIKGEDAEVLAAGLKVQMGSYTGSGAYGKSNPNTLTFSFEPKFVLVYAIGASTDSSDSTGAHLAPAFFLNGSRGVTAFKAGSSYGNMWIDLIATWSGNTLSWYHRNDVDLQKSNSYNTYTYIAFG